MSMLSQQTDWRSAVGEISAEAKYQLRGRPGSQWSFGLAVVSGHMGASLHEITQALDAQLGTGGALLGVVSEGCHSMQSDGLRGHSGVNSPGLMLTAVSLPPGSEKAKPFYIGKPEMLQISQICLRLQSRNTVRGAEEPYTPRAWREFLGVHGNQPRGLLLFVDPLASKYTVSSVLAGLDLAFPKATKFGGVCADLPPSSACLAAAAGSPAVAAKQIGNHGVAGLLLPPCLSLHSIVSAGTTRVGPELRVTLADGQVVSKLNDKPAAEVLADVSKDAGPLERLLLDRSGFLLGLEAPQQPVDPNKSKEYDDLWGSSERLPSYDNLQKRAISSDWLVRSLESMPNDSVVVRREDLKRVPPRVGPSWLRAQLHVRDATKAQEELQLMMQRYLGVRMMMSKAPAPIGAIVCTCASWAAEAEATREKGHTEVGYDELREVWGQQLPITGLSTNGEIAPPGVSVGGVNKRWTTRQGHTSSCCIMVYDPDVHDPDA